MGNHMNTLEQIKRETRDDARLYACIRDLYDQGVSLSDLKALIPDTDQGTASVKTHAAE